MAQNEEVTYELLVYSGTRWETQGTYGAKEHRTAVTDGKALAKVSTVKGVKVVKEFFDNKTNTSRSLTVYEHAPAASAAKKQSGFAKAPKTSTSANKPKPSKASMKGDVREAGEPDEPPRKSSTLFGTFVKIMISLLFSLAAAMVVTQLASVALKGVSSIGMINKADFLVIVFVLVFVITALALVTRVLINLKRLTPILKTRPATPSKPSPAPHKRNKRLTPSADEPKAEIGFKEAEEEKKKAEEEAAQKAAEEARLAEEEARKKAMAEVEARAEADALSEIVTMNAFTQDAFDVLQGDKSKQDAHTVFGLVLFLVGAVQSLRHQHKLGDDVVQTVAGKALGSLGLSAERTQHFLNHTDEYLISNPRYSEMFQTGRAAMGQYLEYNTGPRVVLSDALADWQKPKSNAEAVRQPVTVLFTDIAGSTAMTQKLGDAGAQEVVRAHNRIVREAIQGFSGKEIKHTGDGIMASFPSAVAGVEAAMEMQVRTRTHNASNPNHPLGLKIGLNAGDPISEDDDLFGTTVQLAARIVDKAGSGQVLVSGAVHGLSQGKNLKFERFADLDMKGFDEPITVYTAVWDPNAAKTPAPQPVPPVLEPQAKEQDVDVDVLNGSKTDGAKETKPEAKELEPAAASSPQNEERPGSDEPVDQQAPLKAEEAEEAEEASATEVKTSMSDDDDRPVEETEDAEKNTDKPKSKDQ